MPVIMSGLRVLMIQILFHNPFSYQYLRLLLMFQILFPFSI